MMQSNVVVTQLDLVTTKLNLVMTSLYEDRKQLEHKTLWNNATNSNNKFEKASNY